VRVHEVRLELLVLLEKRAKLDPLALLGTQVALVLKETKVIFLKLIF
jgi:hypothetical protein